MSFMKILENKGPRTEPWGTLLTNLKRCLQLQLSETCQKDSFP